MITEFWAGLDRLAEAVQRNPLVELLSYAPRPPASPELIRESEEQFGIPLPQELVDLYSEHNGVEFAWRLRNDLDTSAHQRVLDGFASLTPTPEYVFDIAGAINIVPVEHFLLLEDYTVPQVELSDPQSPHHQITFLGETYSRNEFNAMLHVFDAAWEDGAMAFVAQPEMADWKMLWLTDNWIFFESSRTISLADYLHLVIATWGLVSARDTVFDQWRGYQEEPMTFDQERAANLVPEILSST